MSIPENQFREMSVDQMWDAYTKLSIDKSAYDQLTQTLSVAIKKIESLESAVSKIDSELAISKSVNVTLKKSVLSLQKKVNEMDQYNRRNNIEIAGVPDEVINLEEKAIALLSKIEVNVSAQDIVACHPLKRKGNFLFRQNLAKSRNSIITPNF